MDIVLAGAGGCMRELLWQFEECGINVLGYTAPEQGPKGGILDNYKYLGDDDYLINSRDNVNVALCFGEPSLRKKVYETLRVNEHISFPTIILKGADVADTTSVGEGCIICRDVVITCDGKIGDFSFINIGALISHDANIGRFTTIGPRASFAGNVTTGDSAFIGIGATVIQGMSIGSEAVVGAGAVVVKPVPDKVTVAGVPAKQI